jgi:hypothetical protein
MPADWMRRQAELAPRSARPTRRHAGVSRCIAGARAMRYAY